MFTSPDDECALELNANTVRVSGNNVQELEVIIDSKLNFAIHVISIFKKNARTGQNVS